MTEASSTGNAATPILARQARYLAGVARRAPSLHNTQPWRFTVSGDAIELRADASRQLSVDPDGREMLISCGAALYGLRLAVRSLGYLPEVEILPGLAGHRQLARVRLGPAAPMTVGERKMLAAVPHRHTHRGPFDAGPLPAGLFARLRDDARAEGAALTEIEPGPTLRRLTAVVAAAGRRQDRDPRSKPRHRDGATGSRARSGTACPRMPSPLSQPARGSGCRSVTSTSAAASACRRQAVPRHRSPPRCSPPATANRTGCRLGRPCTGCCAGRDRVGLRPAEHPAAGGSADPDADQGGPRAARSASDAAGARRQPDRSPDDAAPCSRPDRVARW